jgi:hypothetical protein
MTAKPAELADFLAGTLADGDLGVERINPLLTLPRCGWSIIGDSVAKRGS